MRTSRLLLMLSCLLYAGGQPLRAADDHVADDGKGRAKGGSAVDPIKGCDTQSYSDSWIQGPAIYWGEYGSRPAPPSVKPVLPAMTPTYPYALLTRTEEREWRSSDAGEGGFSSSTHDLVGYHFELSKTFDTDFEVLLGHALRCKVAGDSSFFDELKKRMAEELQQPEKQGQQPTNLMRKRYSYDDQKYSWDREKKDARYQQDYKTLSDRMLQILTLEKLQEHNPAFFVALVEQMRLNGSGKKEISREMINYVLHCRETLKTPSDKLRPEDHGAASILSGAIDSILNPEQGAYYRQLFKLGPNFDLVANPKSGPETPDQTVKNTKYRNDPEVERALREGLAQHYLYLTGETEESAKEKAAKKEAPKVCDASGGGCSELLPAIVGSHSTKERLSYWEDFEEKIGKAIQKYKPEELSKFQRTLEASLEKIDKSPEKSSPHSAYAREALLRASRMVELKKTDPLADRRADEERAFRANYSDHVSEMGLRLKHAQDPGSASVEQMLKDAETLYGINIPLEAANRIREMDPFLLKFIVAKFPQMLDAKKRGDTGAILKLKDFFLTGHSTALFNLGDPALAWFYKDRLEASLGSYRMDHRSTLFSTAKDHAPERLSREEKRTLLDLLDVATLGYKPHDSRKEYFNSDKAWKEDYPRIRARLMNALATRLKDVKGNYRLLSDEEKAAIYTIETIDAMGNHGILPFHNWKNIDNAKFYEVEGVASRLLEEQTLAEKLGKTSSGDVEKLVADTVLTDPTSSPNDPHFMSDLYGVPSHGRLAALQRLAHFKETGDDSEAKALKFYSDFLKRKAVPGHEGQKVRDVIKEFAFQKNSPELMEAALSAQIPELAGLYQLSAPPSASVDPFKEEAKRILRRLSDFTLEPAAVLEHVKKHGSKELVADLASDPDLYEQMLKNWLVEIQRERDIFPVVKKHQAEIDSVAKENTRLEAGLYRELRTDLINEFAKIGGETEDKRQQRQDIGCALRILAEFEEPGSLLNLFGNANSKLQQAALVNGCNDFSKDYLNDGLSDAARKRVASVLEEVGKATEGVQKRIMDEAFTSKSDDPKVKAQFLQTLDQELGKFKRVTKATEAIARIRAQFGDKDPRVGEYEAMLRQGIENQFGVNTFTDDDIKHKLAVADEAHRKDLDVSEKERAKILQDYPKQLSWDVKHQAYVLDEHRAFISPEFVSAFKKLHGARLLFRNHKTGTEKVYENGPQALEAFIQDAPLQLITNGTEYPREKWIPLNEKTAVRFLEQKDGSIKYELADRGTMEKEFQSELYAMERKRQDYIEASERYGDFTHGAEAFFRGLGNFYLFGAVGRPETSARTRLLESSYGDYRAQMEKIRPYGGLSNGRDGTALTDLRAENKDVGSRLLERERQNIQRYLDNAELTHDATLLVLSLPVGGFASFALKGAAGTAEAAASGSMAARVAGFLGKTATGKWVPITTQMARGAIGFNTVLMSSIKTAAVLSGPGVAVGWGTENYLIKSKMAEIRENYNKKGKMWFPYDAKPHQGDPKYNGSHEAWKKDFLEYEELSRFDINGDRIPDFLQPSMAEFALTGPDASRYAKSALDSQKSFFYMNLVGASFPSSGMMTHMFAGGILQNVPDIIVGAPKKGRLGETQNLKDTVTDSAISTATMLPGMLTLKGGMAIYPWNSGRQVFGIASFIAGNQGAHVAHEYISTGELPSLKMKDVPGLVTSVLTEAYIGKGMAKHANAQLARRGLEQAKFVDTSELTKGSNAYKQAEQANEAVFKDLQNKFGKEGVDHAILAMTGRTVASADTLLLREAGKYVRGRMFELRAESERKLEKSKYVDPRTGKPVKETPVEELQRDVQILEAELAGFRRFKLDKGVAAAKSKELSEKKKVLEAKGTETYLKDWLANNEGREHARVLGANLYYLATSPEATKAGPRKNVTDELGKEIPEVAERLIEAANAVPKIERAGQRLGAAVKAIDDKLGLVEQFVRPEAFALGTNEIAHHADAILLRAYTNAKSPQAKAKLLKLLTDHNVGNLANLQTKSIDPKNPQDSEAIRGFATLMWAQHDIPDNGQGFLTHMERAATAGAGKEKDLYQQFGAYFQSEQLVNDMAALKIARRSYTNGIENAEVVSRADKRLNEMAQEYRKLTGYEVDNDVLKQRVRELAAFDAPEPVKPKPKKTVATPPATSSPAGNFDPAADTKPGQQQITVQPFPASGGVQGFSQPGSLPQRQTTQPFQQGQPGQGAK